MRSPSRWLGGSSARVSRWRVPRPGPRRSRRRTTTSCCSTSGLPDIDGFEVCRRLRARSEVPIIVVTARGDEVDRVVGLELGADDYIVKPFGFRELLARIRAVTRRSQARPEDLAPRTVGPLTIDRRTHQVTFGRRVLALTPKEFDLLALLAEEPGTVFARSQILEEVWDAHWYGPTKTLDVHVAALRKKLGDPAWIETVRGVGFRLVEPPSVRPTES